MDNPRLETPVGPRGLHEICDDKDDAQRNWYVTLAYWDLSRMTAAYTHALGAPEVAAADDGGGFAGEEPAKDNDAAGNAAAMFEAEFRAAEGPVTETVASRRPVTSVQRGPAQMAPRAVGGGLWPPDIIAELAELDPPAEAEHPPGEGHGPLNANFCTFATWSSLTLGRDIRNSRLPRRFDRMSDLFLRQAATNLVIEARKTNQMQLSRLLGLGQRVVLWEVGTGLYSMFIGEEILNELPAVKGLRFAAFDGRKDFTDEATSQLGKVLDRWLTSTVKPRGAVGLRQLRTKDLALGLASYQLARRAALEAREGGDDARLRRWVAELILRGNLLIGAYEQRKVDQLLKYPVEDFASEFFLDRSGIKAMERSGEGRWRRRLDARIRRELKHVPELWGRFFTDQMMVFWAGDELLRLGRDLPIPPGSATFLPPDLQVIEDGWLQMLLYRYDHSYGNGHGTQSRIWSVFDDRMNYIANYMRSRAQTPGLWQRPFDPQEEDDLRNHKTPGGQHDAVC